jgi:hypothetical protein
VTFGFAACGFPGWEHAVRITVLRETERGQPSVAVTPEMSNSPLHPAGSFDVRRGRIVYCSPR